MLIPPLLRKTPDTAYSDINTISTSLLTMTHFLCASCSTLASCRDTTPGPDDVPYCMPCFITWTTFLGIMQNQEDSSTFQTPNVKRLKKMKTDQGALTPLLIPPSPCMKRLGYGTGVNVYLIERFSPKGGCYRSPWAVKKINSRLKQHPEFKERLEDETKILKTLDHPNIIGFRSQGKSQDGNLCLVMESGETSLADVIETRLDQDLGPFAPDVILKVAKSMTSALNYLHAGRHLLHGDLKSGNVLIKGDFEKIKLCDFGVTLKLNDKLVIEDPTVCYVGTECWSAPEVLKFGEISNKTDMFSFGLVLWEMIALCPPHQEKLDIDSFLIESLSEKELEEVQAEKEEEYNKVLGTRPCLPNLTLKDGYQDVLEIFSLCTEQDPSSRPSAKQIMDTYFA